MWLRCPLDDVLSSRAKVAALRAICAASAPLSGREIARRAGIASGHASRILRELAASGVLLCRDQGPVKTYELPSTDSPLVEHLKRLFATEAGRYDGVLDAFASQVPGVLSIVLFGSEARGEATPGSDTDLLIVLQHRDAEAEALVRDTCLRLAGQHLLSLSWQVADLSDLRTWDESGHPLWQRILADGIRVWGQPLGRLQQRWRLGRTG